MNDYSFVIKNGIRMISADAINSTGAAQAYITTRHGGISEGYSASMNCNLYKKIDQENGHRNFELFCKAIEVPPETVITNGLTYFTDKVRCVTKSDLINIYDETLKAHADGLVTDDEDITLFLYAADCSIILFVDPVRRVIGALHAGWKGSLIPIIENTVAAMTNQYGCNAEDIIVQICPSIGQCCYSIREEVERQFAEQGHSDCIVTRDGERYIDLNKVNRKRLIGAGIKAGNIHQIGLCTSCNPELFHSYRRGPVIDGIHYNGINGMFIHLNKRTK